MSIRKDAHTVWSTQSPKKWSEVLHNLTWHYCRVTNPEIVPSTRTQYIRDFEADISSNYIHILAQKKPMPDDAATPWLVLFQFVKKFNTSRMIFVSEVLNWLCVRVAGFTLQQVFNMDKVKDFPGLKDVEQEDLDRVVLPGPEAKINPLTIAILCFHKGVSGAGEIVEELVKEGVRGVRTDVGSLVYDYNKTSKTFQEHFKDYDHNANTTKPHVIINVEDLEPKDTDQLVCQRDGGIDVQPTYSSWNEYVSATTKALLGGNQPFLKLDEIAQLFMASVLTEYVKKCVKCIPGEKVITEIEGPLRIFIRKHKNWQGEDEEKHFTAIRDQLKYKK